MREVAQLLNEMRDTGVIKNYALFGAVAQMRYTEPVATLDADVLIAVPSPDRLDVLGDVYGYCRKKGFLPDAESIRVGTWPVQFVPAFNALTMEAMEQADTADYEGVPFRVVRAEHLAVIALSTGRAKDFMRIMALLEAGSVTPDQLAALAGRHGLTDEWNRFTSRFLK